MSSGTTTTGGASRGNFHKARVLGAEAARFNTGIRIAIFGELSHHSRDRRHYGNLGSVGIRPRAHGSPA